MLAVVSSMGQANQNIPVVEASQGVSLQDTSPETEVLAAVDSPSSISVGAQGGQLFYELELLQQEVQQLRGMVEQQDHQIKRMREEQRDRYLDLDRRITLFNQASYQAAPVVLEKPVVKPQATETTIQPIVASTLKQDTVITASVNPASVVDKAAEKKDYQAAFSLVRNKQYAQAVDAFTQQIKTYPDGSYTGNAYYWLGEVLLVESGKEEALTAFNSLLRDFPKHRKASAAKYKQGKIYLQMGQKARAKELLQGVIDQYAGTSVAKLAEAELRDAGL